MKKYTLEVDGHKVGGKGVVVVIDETVTCVGKGIRKAKGAVNHGKPRHPGTRSRSVVRKRILKRLPAQTIHRGSKGKRGPAVKKRPAARPQRTEPKDKRSGGRWVWAAVAVGKGKEVWTHDNQKKRFAFELLPKPSVAPDGKPRGLESIKNTIRKHVAPGSILVFDKWTATVSAVKALGFQHAPAINHTKYFRDTTTGFHSNDIESEFNALKRFIRQRYGVLQLQEETTEELLEAGDIFEYMFYRNVGNKFSDVMAAFAHAQGGCFRPLKL